VTTVLDSDLAGGSFPDSFIPSQVILGDAESTFVTVEAGLSFAKWTVVGLNSLGHAVAWNPAGGFATGAAATDTLTFTAQPTAADTVTINSVVTTFVAAGATAAQVNIGATTAATAAAFAAHVNALTVTMAVNADVVGSVVTLTANLAGTAGNALTVAKSGTYPTLGAATLLGGTADATTEMREGQLWGVMAQPVDATAGDAPGPVFYEGLFNHEALIWPAGITTLDQRRAACVGSGIMVTVLK